MVIRVFEYLVSCELRKQHSGEFREGCQGGCIMTLEILFGSSSDDAVFDEGFNNKKTWSHVTAEIVDMRLSSWTLDVHSDTSLLDYDQMNKEVKEAVRWYALRHPEKMIAALVEYL